MILTGKQINEMLNAMSIASSEDWWDSHSFICKGKLITGKRLTSLWEKEGRIIGQIRSNTNNVYGAPVFIIDITDVPFDVILESTSCHTPG